MEQAKHCAVCAQGLKRRFGKTWALDGFSCEMPHGHIYGLLGRNGAGKSTFLRIATAQTGATQGRVLIDGENPTENARALGKICFISDKPEFGGLRRVSDVLKSAKALYPQWNDAQAKKLCEVFELDVKRKTKGLSRGMQTAVGLVCGLASQAPITIFDEPSLGLDAVIRERFYDALLESYMENPRTIVLSTHLIDEVSRVLETAVMIDKGRLVMQESVESLRTRAICVSGLREEVDAACQKLNILRTEEFAGRTAKYILLDKDQTPDFPDSLRTEPVSLQRLFVLLTDKDMTEGGVSHGTADFNA